MFVQDHKHRQRRDVPESHLSQRCDVGTQRRDVRTQRRDDSKHNQYNVATLISNVTTLQRVQIFNVTTFPRELKNVVCHAKL